MTKQGTQSEWNPTEEELGNVFTPDPNETPPNIVTIPGDFDPEFLKSLVGLSEEDQEAAKQLQIESDATAEALREQETAKQALLEEEQQANKGWIPRGRFNEANDKAKEAEEKIALLQQQLEILLKPEKTVTEPEPDPRDILENQLADLDIASKEAELDYGLGSEEHRTAVKAYNRANRGLMALEASYSANNAVSVLKNETTEMNRIKASLDEVAEKNYEIYPFLDRNGEESNDEAINQVIELRNGFIESGKYNPSIALQKAIDLVAPVYAKIIVPATSTNTTDQAKVLEIAQARERAAREKAALATQKQPAFVVGRSEEGDFKLDIDKMTDAEVAALPKDVLDKLCGNVVIEK